MKPALASRIVKRMFVGRDRELAALDDALDRGIAGDTDPSCAHSGEPGIGKTRLADAFLDRTRGKAKSRAMNLAIGWSRSWDGSSAFGIVHEAISDAIRRTTAATRELRSQIGQLIAPVSSREARFASTLEALALLGGEVGGEGPLDTKANATAAILVLDDVVCEVWDFQGDKVAGIRNYQDAASILRQIGVM